MSIRQKSLRGLFWSAAQTWGGQAISLVVFALLARLLDPTAFGLIALANLAIAFFMVFADQGFKSAIVQRRDLTDKHLNTAFWTNLATAFLLALLGVSIAGMAGRVFQQPDLSPIIQCLSVLFLISSLSSVQEALLQRRMQFRTLAIRKLVGTLVGGLVGVTMALTGYEVWSLVGQQLASYTIQVLALWKLSDWRPKLEFSQQHFRDLFSFGANIVGINFTEFFSRHSDNFLIGYFLGPTALGYYSLAYKLLQTMTRMFSAVISQVSFPTFSTLQGSPERMRSGFYLATRLTALVAIPVFLGMSLLAPDLTKAVFGQQWGASVPVIQVLALAGILESVYFYNANVMLAMGKPFWRLKLNILNAVVNVAAFAIAVRWGIVAVAAAYVLRAYLLSPLPLMLVRRLIDIQIGLYLRNLVTPLLASPVMIVGMSILRSYLSSSLSLPALIAVSVAAGFILYFLAALSFSPDVFRQASSLVNRAPRS